MKAEPTEKQKANDTFTEQAVNTAAKGILEAALRNDATNQQAIVNGLAASQLAVSGIPFVGPIIGAVLVSIAATIQADQSQKKTATVDFKPGWNAINKDRNDP